MLAKLLQSTAPRIFLSSIDLVSVTFLIITLSDELLGYSISLFHLLKTSMWSNPSMSTCVNGVNCGVIEWVKRNTLKWIGHIERMGSEEFVKKEGPNRRGRPLGRWKDRMEEYLRERGIMGGEDLNRQRGSFGKGRGGDFCHGHSLGGHSWKEWVVRAIGRLGTLKDEKSVFGGTEWVPMLIKPGLSSSSRGESQKWQIKESSTVVAVGGNPKLQTLTKNRF